MKSHLHGLPFVPIPEEYFVFFQEVCYDVIFSTYKQFKPYVHSSALCILLHTDGKNAKLLGVHHASKANLHDVISWELELSNIYICLNINMDIHIRIRI